MMPSIVEQLRAYTAPRILTRDEMRDKAVKNRPSDRTVERAFKMLSATPITSREVCKILGTSVSTAQACLQILCEEQGRAARVENGSCGAKRYVLAEVAQ